MSENIRVGFIKAGLHGLAANLGLQAIVMGDSIIVTSQNQERLREFRQFLYDDSNLDITKPLCWCVDYVDGLGVDIKRITINPRSVIQHPPSPSVDQIKIQKLANRFRFTLMNSDWDPVFWVLKNGDIESLNSLREFLKKRVISFMSWDEPCEVRIYKAAFTGKNLDLDFEAPEPWNPNKAPTVEDEREKEIQCRADEAAAKKKAAMAASGKATGSEAVIPSKDYNPTVDQIKIQKLADRFGFTLLSSDSDPSYWVLKYGDIDSLNSLREFLKKHAISFSFSFWDEPCEVRIHKATLAVVLDLDFEAPEPCIPNKAPSVAPSTVPPSKADPQTTIPTKVEWKQVGGLIERPKLHKNLEIIYTLAAELALNVEITMNGHLKIYGPKPTDFVKNFRYRVFKAYVRVYPNITHCQFDGYVFVTVDGEENPDKLMCVELYESMVIHIPSSHHDLFDELDDLLTQKSIDHGVKEHNGISSISIKIPSL